MNILQPFLANIHKSIINICEIKYHQTIDMNINIVQQHLDWFVIVVNCTKYIGWKIVKLSQISSIKSYIQIWRYNWPTLVKCYQATLVYPILIECFPTTLKAWWNTSKVEISKCVKQNKQTTFINQSIR